MKASSGIRPRVLKTGYPGFRTRDPPENCRNPGPRHAPAGASRPRPARRAEKPAPCGRSPSAQAVKKATTVQQIAARPAAMEAWGICVLTWSIRSQPVHIELSTVVSEIGEHWSP